jgi:hypothetical protein
MELEIETADFFRDIRIGPLVIVVYVFSILCENGIFILILLICKAPRRNI